MYDLVLVMLYHTIQSTAILCYPILSYPTLSCLFECCVTAQYHTDTVLDAALHRLNDTVLH